MITNRSEEQIARIIVDDSIKYSYTEGGGLPEVEAALDALRGPSGNELTQAMIGTYCGGDNSGGAAESIDARVLETGVRITAEKLQKEMERQLELFVSSPSHREDYLRELQLDNV